MSIHWSSGNYQKIQFTQQFWSAFLAKPNLLYHLGQPNQAKETLIIREVETTFVFRQCALIWINDIQILNFKIIVPNSNYATILLSKERVVNSGDSQTANKENVFSQNLNLLKNDEEWSYSEFLKLA